MLFTVSDTGVGMSSDQLSHLFQPFNQGDNSVTRRFGGTGLGLAISKRLALMMEGDLTASSEPGQGSQFTLAIPMPDSSEMKLYHPATPVFVARPTSQRRPPGSKAIEERFDPPVESMSTWQSDSDLYSSLGVGQPVASEDDQPEQLPQPSTPELTAEVLSRSADASPASIADEAGDHDQPQGRIYINDEPLPESASRRMAAPETEGPRKARVLLAEDGVDNQRLIGFILRRAGIDVTVAEDGQQAVDLILPAIDSEEPFDLVLMDIQMPVLDGINATAIIREAGYVGPIVALTAHAMKGDREQCLAAGCDDFATKPIDRETFITKIEQYLTAKT